MRIDLRPASLQDLDELAVMNQQLIQDEGSQNPMTHIELAERMEAWLQGDWRAILIEIGGTVVGYILFRQHQPESPAQGTEIYVRHYFVKRVFRGKGIGQAAFERIQADYFPPDARVVLDVLATNPRGRHFWEKLGFVSHYENLRLEKRAILQQQIDYYRARAGEYDEWFYRQGRYDHGPELNQQWFDEVQQVMARLQAIGPVDEALELACGTGIWTEQLLSISQHITALDAAAEVIAINRAKLNS